MNKLLNQLIIYHGQTDCHQHMDEYWIKLCFAIFIIKLFNSG